MWATQFSMLGLLPSATCLGYLDQQFGPGNFRTVPVRTASLTKLS